MVVQYVADERELKCPMGKVAAEGTGDHPQDLAVDPFILTIAVTSAEIEDIMHETVTDIGVVGGTGMTFSSIIFTINFLSCAF